MDWEEQSNSGEQLGHWIIEASTLIRLMMMMMTMMMMIGLLMIKMMMMIRATGLTRFQP